MYWTGSKHYTIYIEDGLEKRIITGAIFVDLSAVYDTVNRWLLLMKVDDLNIDYDFVELLRSLLKDRRFYVTLQSRSSR